MRSDNDLNHRSGRKHNTLSTLNYVTYFYILEYFIQSL